MLQASCFQLQGGEMITKNEGYNKLIVYQKADELAYKIYQATKYFPGDELYGITSQMRRASTSVAANIVEGYMRETNKERLRFYNISQASLIELEYFIEFSHKLGYLKHLQYTEISNIKSEVGRLLYGFIKSVKNYGNTKLEARSLKQEAINA
jgi:four helix bundle protein